MSLIGHVYPALFYLGVGALMLHQTASSLRRASLTTTTTTTTSTLADDADSHNSHHPLAPTNGGSRFVFRFGLAVALVTLTGITVEAAGGLLATGNLLFQAAHQSIHFSFFVAGVGAVLESYKRAPLDTWRGLTAVGFLVQALVFYGHQQEQLVPESTLHFVLAVASALVSLAFFLATWAPRAVMLHLVCVAGILFHGLWLMWIGVVVYTPLFGVPDQKDREREAKKMGQASPSMSMSMGGGEDGLMPADVFLHAGFALVLVVAFVGGVLVLGAGRPWAEPAADLPGDFSFPPTLDDWAFARRAAGPRKGLALLPTVDPHAAALGKRKPAGFAPSPASSSDDGGASTPAVSEEEEDEDEERALQRRALRG